MRLVIETWWEDVETGRRVERPTFTRNDSGWHSVVEMQRKRLPYYKGHPYERAIRVRGGFMLRELTSHFGYRTVQRVTLEDEADTVWVFRTRRRG